MKKKKTMAALWAAAHKGTFLLGALFFLITAVVFWLYRLPAEAVLYAWILCLAVAVPAAVYSFSRFCARYDALQKALELGQSGVWELPKAADAIEEQYQKIVNAMVEEKKRLAEEYEEKEQERNEYYTMWVHQIKTPISAMNLVLQLHDGPEYGRLKASLFKIEQYVEMALQYVRADSPDLVFATCSLDSIIRQAIHKYAPMFIDKKIGLDYRPADSRVLTDEKWLQFVIEQLLSNALKYTNEGTITIRVEEEKPSGNQPENGGPVLMIEDTGIGIVPEDLSRIFENGYTGNNGRLQKRATGIGLYLCRKILTRLGHSIEIESEVDKGTRVRLHLGTVNLKTE